LGGRGEEGAMDPHLRDTPDPALSDGYPPRGTHPAHGAIPPQRHAPALAVGDLAAPFAHPVSG
ncbi:hypothetical protein V492_02688, partial [Pseudogymnoascus sp. VKM F-4246]